MKAIVTGHTRGLGAALAAELLARGARVLGISRSSVPHPSDRLQQVVADLADPDAVIKLAADDGALRRFLADGGDEPVLLLNNAGVVDPIGPAGTLDPASITRAVTLNVTAPLLLADAFISATRQNADRRVLHVSSGAARNPYAGWSIYCATKAALDHHARSVTADAVAGLRIASVAPGVIDTDMQASLRATSAAQFPMRDRFVSLKENGALTTPAACAARLVAYLLTPEFGTPPVTDIREMV